MIPLGEYLLLIIIIISSREINFKRFGDCFLAKLAIFLGFVETAAISAVFKLLHWIFIRSGVPD